MNRRLAVVIAAAAIGSPPAGDWLTWRRTDDDLFTFVARGPQFGYLGFGVAMMRTLPLCLCVFVSIATAQAPDKTYTMYEFTIDDPFTYTKPWTVQTPWVKSEGLMFEYACHEGNYGLPNVLRGQRMLEAEAAAGAPGAGAR